MIIRTPSQPPTGPMAVVIGKPLVFCCGALSLGIGSTVAAGPFHHWSLSSYACELWAVLVAFFGSSTKTVFTDRLSVFDTFNSISKRNLLIHPGMVYQHRTAFSNNSLSLKWCPAHVLDHFMRACLILEKWLINIRPPELIWYEIHKLTEPPKRLYKFCFTCNFCRQNLGS